MNKYRLYLTVVLLVLASLACNAVMGTKDTPAPQPLSGEVSPTETVVEQAATAPAENPSPTEILPIATLTSQPEDDSQEYNTEFPLPDEISGFMDLGDKSINFQTKMELKEAIAFYRDGMAQQGYKEREINTAITETVFSLVFDGHSSGKAIVVQGVDLGGGTLNIIINLVDI